MCIAKHAAGFALVVGFGLVAASVPGLAATPPRGSLAETWHTVEVRQRALSQAIRQREFGKVEKLAAAVCDLVTRLPSRSSRLSADRAERLRDTLHHLTAICARLTSAAADRDQAKTEAAFGQLRAALGAVQDVYPPGMLE